MDRIALMEWQVKQLEGEFLHLQTDLTAARLLLARVHTELEAVLKMKEEGHCDRCTLKGD